MMMMIALVYVRNPVRIMAITVIVQVTLINIGTLSPYEGQTEIPLSLQNRLDLIRH